MTGVDVSMLGIFTTWKISLILLSAYPDKLLCHGLTKNFTSALFNNLFYYMIGAHPMYVSIMQNTSFPMHVLLRVLRVSLMHVPILLTFTHMHVAMQRATLGCGLDYV